MNGMRTPKSRGDGGRRPAVVGAVVLVASMVSTSGCATGPGASAGSARYQGDAVWNISRAEAEPSSGPADAARVDV